MSDAELFDPKKLDDKDYLAALEELVDRDGGLSSIDPTSFAKLVKRTSDGQLRALEKSPLLEPVVQSIFTQMGSYFRPESIKSDKESTIRWVITGTEDDLVHETTVSAEGCTVTEGAQTSSPRATLTLGGSNFLKLASGNASPPMMFMKRKLKLSGDVGFATALPKLFDIPKA